MNVPRIQNCLEIELPFPPSVNGLYSTNFKTKRRFKSKRYAEWTKLAEQAFYKAHPIPFQAPLFTASTNIIYCFQAPDKRQRDLSNCIKAIDDFLVERNVLEDDRIIHHLTALWADQRPDFQCKRPSKPGVMLTISNAGWGL